MSATATVPPTTAAPAVGNIRVTFPRLMKAEWIKLWTLRSTWWAVPLTIAVQAGFTWLVAFLNMQQVDDFTEFGMSRAEVAPQMLTQGVLFGQLVISVLAVLAITGEYSTGSIRSTLAAAPRRLDMLAAKCLVMLTVAFGTGLVAAVLSWALTAPVLSPDYPFDFSNEIHRRVLIGIPLYLVGIALFSFAIGAMLRHSAAALSTVFGVLLVVETVVASVSGVRFFQVIAPFMPSNAGTQIFDTSTESIESLRAASDVAVLTPWQGFGVLIAWGVVLYAVASVLLRKRDA